MQKITKNVDALGFDKWQIADVRRAYASNKAIYTKMNKLAEKITALVAEYDAKKAELEAWEGPVKLITQKVLGMDLTSQEVLAYHKEPHLFAEKYPDHPASEVIRTMTPEETAESVEAEPVDAESAEEPDTPSDASQTEQTEYPL